MILRRRQSQCSTPAPLKYMMINFMRRTMKMPLVLLAKACRDMKCRDDKTGLHFTSCTSIHSTDERASLTPSRRLVQPPITLIDTSRQHEPPRSSQRRKLRSCNTRSLRDIGHGLDGRPDVHTPRRAPSNGTQSLPRHDGLRRTPARRASPQSID